MISCRVHNTQCIFSNIYLKFKKLSLYFSHALSYTTKKPKGVVMPLKTGPKAKTQEGKDDKRQRTDRENPATQKKHPDLKVEVKKKK